EPGIGGVTLTLIVPNGLIQSFTATRNLPAFPTRRSSDLSNNNVLRPGTYQIVETVPSGYLTGAAAVGTVNGTADGTVSSATQIRSIKVTRLNYSHEDNFYDVKPVNIKGLVYDDTNGNNAL